MKFFSKKNPFIIAEIASAHDGSIKKLIKLTELSIKTGANAIKFQIFKTSNFISKYNPMFKEFKKIEINFKEWERLFLKFEKYKNKIIIEPYDIESLHFCKKLNIFSAIKIPTTCMGDINYINEIKKINKSVILGVGGTDITEIKSIYNNLKKKNKEIALIYGIQNFPTKIKDLNLNKISFLRKNFDCIIGYADHTDSEDRLSSNFIPLKAHSLGADIIEKHITIDRSLKGRDYFSAFNPDEFKNFIDIFKINTDVVGINNWKLNEADKKYARFSKKYAVASKNLKKNMLINAPDVNFKRTNVIGIENKDLNKIINKKLKKNIKKDQILKLNILNK